MCPRIAARSHMLPACELTEKRGAKKPTSRQLVATVVVRCQIGGRYADCQTGWLADRFGADGGIVGGWACAGWPIPRRMGSLVVPGAGLPARLLLTLALLAADRL